MGHKRSWGVVLSVVASSAWMLSLAIAVGATEWLVGLMLAASPLGRRMKSIGFGLMRGSFNPTVFVVLISALASVLVTSGVNDAIQSSLQSIIQSDAAIRKEMLQYQTCNVSLVVNLGFSVAIIAFLSDVVKAVFGDLLALNPLPAMSAGAQAAQSLANVLARTSNTYGLVIVVHTLFVGFMVLMAAGWAMLVDMGAFMYILPFGLGRRVGKFLVAFPLAGYLFIPVFWKMQQLILSWMQASGNNVYSICSAAGGILNGVIPNLNVFQFAPVYSAFMYITVPAMYFGFVAWGTAGVGAAAAFRKFGSLSGVRPMGGFQRLHGMVAPTLRHVGRMVKTEVLIHHARSKLSALSKKLDTLQEDVTLRIQPIQAAIETGLGGGDPEALDHAQSALAAAETALNLLRKSQGRLQAAERHVSYVSFLRRSRSRAMSAARDIQRHMEDAEKLGGEADALYGQAVTAASTLFEEEEAQPSEGVVEPEVETRMLEMAKAAQLEAFNRTEADVNEIREMLKRDLGGTGGLFDNPQAGRLAKTAKQHLDQAEAYLSEAVGLHESGNDASANEYLEMARRQAGKARDLLSGAHALEAKTRMRDIRRESQFQRAVAEEEYQLPADMEEDVEDIEEAIESEGRSDKPISNVELTDLLNHLRRIHDAKANGNEMNAKKLREELQAKLKKLRAKTNPLSDA